MVLWSGIKVSCPQHFNESFEEVEHPWLPLKGSPYNLTIPLPMANFIWPSQTWFHG